MSTPTQPPVPEPPAGGDKHLPPPGTPAPAPGHEVKAPGADKRLRGFQIATGVLAVTTVAGLIWGFTATKSANDTNATQQAQITQLQQELKAAQSDEAKEQAQAGKEIERYRREVEQLKGSLRVDTKDLKGERQQLAQLQAQYKRDAAAAAQEDATLKDQLTAAQSKAQLSQQCASVMASGLVKIYEDVPTVVTYREVASVLNAARAECSGVVTVNAP